MSRFFSRARSIFILFFFFAGVFVYGNRAFAMHVPGNYLEDPTVRGYAGLCYVGTPDNSTPPTATYVIANTVDEVRNFNNLYFQYWARDARCDELQFHVDHVTPHDTLAAWLQANGAPRNNNARTEGDLYVYREDGTATYEYTFGTNAIDRLEGHSIMIGSGLFLIQNGRRYRVPDLPTLHSWGLLPQDSWMIRGGYLNDYFLQKYPLGGNLQYTEGAYYEEIQDYWNSEGEDVSESLPQSMKDLLAQETADGIPFGHWIWLGTQTPTQEELNANRALDKIYYYDWSNFDWSYLD